MLSKFGQLVRALRLEKDMLMSDMATSLNVSPSYLSAVEFGRRPVPEAWPEQISRILKLDEDAAKLIFSTAVASSSRSRGEVKVSLEDLTPLQEEVALAFARKIRELTENELTAIKSQLLEERSSEQNWRRGSR